MSKQKAKGKEAERARAEKAEVDRQDKAKRKEEKMSDPKNQCLAVVKELQGLQGCGSFNEPVRWQELQLWEYPKCIKQPMDLTTVRTCLANGHYSTVREFMDAVRLVRCEVVVR
jgi:hypothetical protein